MYKILENAPRMTRAQILEEFDGKWVFLVKMEGPPFKRFDTAVPAVVADMAYEGRETGIYKRLDAENGGNSMNISLLHNEPNAFGFVEVVRDGD